MLDFFVTRFFFFFNRPIYLTRLFDLSLRKQFFFLMRFKCVCEHDCLSAHRKGR